MYITSTLNFSYHTDVLEYGIFKILYNYAPYWHHDIDPPASLKIFHQIGKKGNVPDIWNTFCRKKSSSSILLVVSGSPSKEEKGDLQFFVDYQKLNIFFDVKKEDSTLWILLFLVPTSCCPGVQWFCTFNLKNGFGKALSRTQGKDGILDTQSDI